MRQININVYFIWASFSLDQLRLNINKAKFKYERGQHMEWRERNIYA